MTAKCSSRKIEYRTEARANLALAVHPPNWETYRCAECGWWHLTSAKAKCWSCGDPLAGNTCVNDDCGQYHKARPVTQDADSGDDNRGRPHGAGGLVLGERGLEPEEPEVWAGLWEE